MKKESNSALSSHAWNYLENVKTADILVGIPSYNNAHTINYVVYQAAKGLENHFPNRKSAIFVSDGNSTDGTLETVKSMQLPFKADVIPVTYVGFPGKGSAVKAIFEAAKFLGVRAVALVDSDLRSITPEWIKLLISPTLTGTGLVTPFYIRHKYDGTITNFLCYPVTSSLYGKEIRQPIGGDFGLSRELVEKLLESPLWQTNYVRRFGIDILETHTALAHKFEVKQAFLGTKVHEAKDPSKHLAPMFRQVIGSMFTCIERYDKVWKEIGGLRSVEIVGEKRHLGMQEPIHINLQNIMNTYKSGFKDYRRIYRAILNRDVFQEIEKTRKREGMKTSFSPENWAKIVYSFVAGFRKKEQRKREQLLNALRIFWIGKIASFITETSEIDTLKAEKKIQEETKTFVKLKHYLLDIF